METEYTRAIVAENQAAMHEATTNNNVVAAGDIAVADSAFTAIDGTTTNIASIQPENIARDSALHNHIMVGMSAVQNRRPESEMQEDERALWVELDRLMVAIKSIVQRRVHNHAQLRLASLPPPAYSDDSYTSPNSPDLVALGGVKQKDKKSAVQHHHHKHTASSSSIPDEEVGLLLSAIERVLIHAPRLNAQDFLMTEVQSKKLSGAVLANLVERLMKRSEGFENQRVDSTNSKFSTLNQLVSQITTAHKRSLVNQRAVLMPGHVEKIEMGKISKVVERQQKSRFPNQVNNTSLMGRYGLDSITYGPYSLSLSLPSSLFVLFQKDWISPEARLIENLEKLNHELDNLASTLHTSNNSSAMNQQRFRMTEEKEKAMYISGVMGKMEKMGKQRLGNQDSMTPAQIKQEKFDELNKIMDRMTTASPLQDQRFTPKRS